MKMQIRRQSRSMIRLHVMKVMPYFAPDCVLFSFISLLTVSWLLLLSFSHTFRFNSDCNLRSQSRFMFVKEELLLSVCLFSPVFCVIVTCCQLLLHFLLYFSCTIVYSFMLSVWLKRNCMKSASSPHSLSWFVRSWHSIQNIPSLTITRATSLIYWRLQHFLISFFTISILSQPWN